MKRIILILLAAVLLVSCGKKAEEPSESEPTPSESETMPTESETAPSDSESDTVQATELDHHIEMYDESDIVYAKELTPVKRVENPTYRIEGYYSTPSEAFADYPIIHCHGNFAEKPWNQTTRFFSDIVTDIAWDLTHDLVENAYYDKIEVKCDAGEERKNIDYLSTDCIILNDNAKIPNAFVVEADETVGLLAELIAIADEDGVDSIDYRITKIFLYGQLIDLSEYLIYIVSPMHECDSIYFQCDNVYLMVNGGRLKITEDDVSLTEGFWDYFYDETGIQAIVYDEYGQMIGLGFHAGKKYEDFYPRYQKPIDKLTLPYWD